ncbi:NUDIX hydrolase [Pseudochryseolinea flava]|uniref:NUDIX hydrolase n=1 Tax=Pseudochryseolinea flava TaxID=2059302 RepID=A0A364Y4H8_9BACT|nr:NUDIX hydrolase [Pseudochryseolinea flava]RAW01723.1 NUDIX hydrolase [Pseudochryseolinea flava]
MKTRPALIAAIQQYESLYSTEQNYKQQFLDLLKHNRCYHRDFLPGHMTGSAWILDDSMQYVLLTLHAKLNRWLQPGGHADGDENIFQVALREATEETGLKTLTPLSPDLLFDIDVHLIPARSQFQAHDHYDVRFVFVADKNEKLDITDESHDLQWVPLKKLESFTDNNSLFRMREKTSHLRS